LKDCSDEVIMEQVRDLDKKIKDELLKQNKMEEK